MKILLVDERFFDFSILQNCVSKGVCSLYDIDMFITGQGCPVPKQIPASEPEEALFPDPPQSAGTRQQQLILKQAKSYLSSHYMDFDCSLSSVAEFIHMSPSHLSFIFKKEVGTTFINYLTDLRIKKAKQLLSSTDLMVYEVSTNVGYENYAYFSTVFKKSVGLSPKEYRIQERCL